MLYDNWLCVLLYMHECINWPRRQRWSICSAPGLKEAVCAKSLPQLKWNRKWVWDLSEPPAVTRSLLSLWGSPLVWRDLKPARAECKPPSQEQYMGSGSLVFTQNSTASVTHFLQSHFVRVQHAQNQDTNTHWNVYSCRNITHIKWFKLYSWINWDPLFYVCVGQMSFKMYILYMF